MKKIKTLIIFAAVVTGTSTYAEGSLLKALDQNGDGSLQQAEIDMAVSALRKLDSDKDGTVSSSELAAAPTGESAKKPGNKKRSEKTAQTERGGQRGGPDLSRLDTNGDGKISKEEAPERMKERFDMIDTNGDGYLDKSEQERLMQRMRDSGRSGEQRSGMSKGGKSASGGETPKRPAPIE